MAKKKGDASSTSQTVATAAVTAIVGQQRRSKRLVSLQKAELEQIDASLAVSLEEAAAAVAAAGVKRKRKCVPSFSSDSASPESEDDVLPATTVKNKPAKRTKRAETKAKAKTKAEAEADTKIPIDFHHSPGEQAEEGESVPKPARIKRKKGARKAKEKVAVNLSKGGEDGKYKHEDEGDDDDNDFAPKEKKKPKKARAPKPEPVYVIPDVERKQTTFRGRLGYACLNTVLRNKKPASESVFCSRTCRLESLMKNGMDWVKDLGRKNVQDLMTMIQWNEDNNIRFLRVSSEIFPFASHKAHGYTLEFCDDLLAKAGALANGYGHRLTTHPGQYTQLGSPKPEVVASAVKELEYHCEMLDRMGMGKDSVMIVHGGGVYDDKPKALGRIRNTIVKVLRPNVRARLVLENDELCYSAEDLLPLCEELDVPLVFDYHHDNINPSSIPPREIIRRANAIWARRGIRPKQHLSEARPGAVTIMERRAHADRCERLPEELPDDMDLMIEAKDKEQAVLQLYRMYGLHPVQHSSLRPPNPNPTKETNGRKSNKKAAAAAAAARDAKAARDVGGSEDEDV